jgi:hypothetical protein
MFEVSFNSTDMIDTGVQVLKGMMSLLDRRSKLKTEHPPAVRRVLNYMSHGRAGF